MFRLLINLKCALLLNLHLIEKKNHESHLKVEQKYPFSSLSSLWRSIFRRVTNYLLFATLKSKQKLVMLFMVCSILCCAVSIETC